MRRRPPRSTLLPYSTLFRSRHVLVEPPLGFTEKVLRPTVELRPRLAAAEGESNRPEVVDAVRDRKSTRLNSSHANISYAVFCLKNKTHKLSTEQTIPSIHHR